MQSYFVLPCCAGDGRGPSYTFVYPNLMVNRYSLWMGTMRVTPFLLDSLPPGPHFSAPASL
jgi:hypothetical protein